MNKLKKISLNTVLVLAILAAVLIFMTSGIKDVSVNSFRITGLEGLDTEGFTLAGELLIENPARISVPIKDIKYDVVLNDTGEVVSTGSIPSFILKGRQISPADFSQRVEWTPTVQTAVRLVTQDQVRMDVVGSATVDVYGLTTYTLPFSQQIDIKEYVVNHMERNASEDVSNVINKVGELI